MLIEEPLKKNQLILETEVKFTLIEEFCVVSHTDCIVPFSRSDSDQKCKMVTWMVEAPLDCFK